MNAVTSLYIPHVEKQYNAEFIADLFSKNGLAQVSKIYIEPYKTNIKNHSNKYNRVYIQIDSWHETEAAYSFIQRLRNPIVEARLVYSDDNWWSVEINKNPTKFNSDLVLTVFAKPNEIEHVDELEEENDSYSTIAVGYVEEDDTEDFIIIDVEKTNILRDIVAKFKENQEKILMQQEDEADYEEFLREIDLIRKPIYNEITVDMWNQPYW
jgi:hypothetical protein